MIHDTTSLAEIVTAYVAAVDLLYSASANNTPNCNKIHEWMGNPILGDLVFVRPVRRGTDPMTRIGVYVGAWSYIFPPENDEPFVERGSEEVHLLRTFDGEWFQWSNVDIVKVPRAFADVMAASYG